jgi:ubiquitin C-terminal hydrolase
MAGCSSEVPVAAAAAEVAGEGGGAVFEILLPHSSKTLTVENPSTGKAYLHIPGGKLVRRGACLEAVEEGEAKSRWSVLLKEIDLASSASKTAKRQLRICGAAQGPICFDCTRATSNAHEKALDMARQAQGGFGGGPGAYNPINTLLKPKPVSYAASASQRPRQLSNVARRPAPCCNVNTEMQDFPGAQGHSVYRAPMATKRDNVLGGCAPSSPPPSTARKALGSPGRKPVMSPQSRQSFLQSRTEVRDRSGPLFNQNRSIDGMHEGFANLGNTCYLNAVLAALLGLKQFSEDIRAAIWTKVVLSRPAGDAVLYRALLDVILMRQEDHHGVIRPRRLKDAMEVHSERFAGNDQQDAHELLMDLINALYDELAPLVAPRNKLDSPPVWAMQLPTTRSFHSEVDVCLTCPRCRYTRHRTELYWDFSLDLPSEPPTSSGGLGVMSLLDTFFEDKTIPLKCEECGHGLVDVSTSLQSLPGTLILHVKRFKLNAEGTSYVKLLAPLEVPHTLNLAAYCSEFTVNNTLEPLGPPCDAATVHMQLAEGKPSSELNLVPDLAEPEAKRPRTGTAACEPPQRTSVNQIIQHVKAHQGAAKTDGKIQMWQRDGSENTRTYAKRQASAYDSAIKSTTNRCITQHATQHAPTARRALFEESNVVFHTGLGGDDEVMRKVIELSALESANAEKAASQLEAEDDRNFQQALALSVQYSTAHASTEVDSDARRICDRCTMRKEADRLQCCSCGEASRELSKGVEPQPRPKPEKSEPTYLRESLYGGEKERIVRAKGENLHSQYALTAVVHHLGHHAFAGHYVTDVKSGDKWQRHDDSVVREVDPEKVVQGQSAATCYILIFSLKRAERRNL